MLLGRRRIAARVRQAVRPDRHRFDGTMVRQPARFPQPYPRDARCRGADWRLSTFGPDNFEEIRATTGDGLVYYTSAELAGLLKQAGLTIEEQKEYARRLEFGSPDRRTAAHQGDRGKRNPQNPLDPATADRFRNALPQPVFDFFRHSDTYLSPDPDRGEKIETLREQAEAPGTKTYTSNRS